MMERAIKPLKLLCKFLWNPMQLSSIHVQIPICLS